MSFYQLAIFNQEAVNWHIAGLLVENRMNAQVLYEGNIQNNEQYQPAIYNLLERPGRRRGECLRQLCTDRARKVGRSLAECRLYNRN